MRLMSEAVVVLDADTLSAVALADAVVQHSPRAIVALHAVHCGRVFVGVKKSSLPPVILLLGGTDVNSLSSSMSGPFATSLGVSSAIVAFSEDLREQFHSVCIRLRLHPPPVTVIPQSVDVSCRLNGDVQSALGLPSKKIAIWAGGLRAVKDPLFILDEWISAFAAGGDFCDASLLIVGPSLDPQITAQVHRLAGVTSTSPFGGQSGIFVHPAIEREIMLGWIQSAAVLLNTSISEGMSGCILEAQALGVPVAARRCRGNECLVVDGVTGLLFTTPKEAVSAVSRVFSEHDSLAKALASWAIRAISAHHSIESERTAWLRVIGSATATDSVPPQICTHVSPSQCQYVSHSLPRLSIQQRTLSERVVLGLSWLGPRRIFAPVIDPSALSDAAHKAAPRPLAWGTAGDFDAERWKECPHVFDFSKSTEDVSGLGWGRYWEVRGIYAASAHFSSGTNARELHLGVDLGVCSGVRVCAPIAARVHSVGLDNSPLGYGAVVILCHTIVMNRKDCAAERLSFYTLYGHLAASSVFSSSGVPRDGLKRGQTIDAGEVFARIGSSDENGGWFPHLHFQLVTELGFGGWIGDYPGVSRVCDAAAYSLLTPDANIILRCPWLKPEGGWDPSGCADASVDGVAVTLPSEDELRLG